MATKYSAIALLLVTALVIGSTPNAARADDENANADRPIRLYATARFGPIGAVSSGSVVVNGRLAGSEQTIWGGELIEAPSDRSVRVSFESIGEVTLTSGAMVRFGTALAHENEFGRHVLIASLINGGLRVRLEQDAGAYVEAANSTFTASANARFNVSMRDGLASVETMSGSVTAEQQPTTQRRYILRPPQGQGATLSVAARSTRQVQIQVTDENDRPIPDLPLLFSLGSPCLGSLGIGAGAGALFREKTDNRGIATVPWVVGAAKCAGSIIIKVEGSDASFTYQAKVGKQTFFSARNSVLLGAAAAAAGVGIGVAVSNSGGGKEAIIAVPPPQVRP